MWFASLLGILFTYIGSSLVIFLLLVRLTRSTDEEAAGLFFLTIGLGPITISWLLTRLLSAFPGHSDLFYITFIVSCFAIPFFFCLNKLYLIRYLFKEGLTKFKEFQFSKRWFETTIFIIVLSLICFVFLLSIILPITENDAVQYATVARMVCEYKSISFYPVINPDPQTGFYASSCHPLGYISLMSWSYMMQGSSQYAGLAKLISSMYALHTLMLLWYMLLRRGNVYGLFGMFLLITTPAYFLQSAYCGIDAIRIYIFFLAFVCLLKLIRNRSLWLLVFTGFVIGMSMYSHSIGGVFTIPFFVFIYFIKARERYSTKIIILSSIIGVALLFGGSRYLLNYQTFGTPFYDAMPVNQLKEVAHTDWVRYERGLSTFTDRVIWGMFSGFTTILHFGVGCWLFALALISYFFKFFKVGVLSSVFLWVIALFYVMVAFSLIIGMDTFIGNYRYILSIQPFIAFWGALFMGSLYEKIVNR